MTATLKKISFCIAGVFLLLSGCSIKQMAFNGLANTLAPFPAPKTEASGGIDAAAALTGEDDIKLVSDVFPTVLKTYEILHLSNPKHRGLAIMSGSLYVMYANAFVQTPADYIPETQFQKKNLEYLRAKKFYLRGAGYVMESLNGAYKGFAEAMAHYTEDKGTAFLARCRAADVESLYWAGCGILGAVDMGWIPASREVGLSGLRLAPRLYFALGVSGANFHTIGMYRSKLIVAVNIEENARIFHIADYCIYAEAETVLDGLLAALPDRVFQGEGETEAFILTQLKAYPFRYNPVRKNE